MSDIRILNGRHQAQKIAEHISIAFWIGETLDDPGYHMVQVYAEFLELAEKLGYTVSKSREDK